MFNVNKLNSIIGNKFFYADEETGIGWESQIDEIRRNWDDFGIVLCLSCGTEVKISGIDIMFKNSKALYTNLKD